MGSADARLWVPGAMFAALLAARFVYGWIVPTAGVWWVATIDASLVFCSAFIATYYTRTLKSQMDAVEAVSDRAGRLELVTRELVDNEAVMREDLVRGQRELNERILRLSSLLDATRELVGARNLVDALQHVADMTCKVMGADKATISVTMADEALTVVSTGTNCSDSLLFRSSSEIVLFGDAAGELVVEFANISPGNADAGSFLSIISAFASAAIENAMLYRNLTEANEKLEVSRRYAERLIEEAPLGMVVIDDECRVLTWNRALAEITNVCRGAATGKDLHDIITGSGSERLFALIDKASAEGDSTVAENIALHIEHGDDHIFRIIVSPVERLLGDNPGFIIMAEDVTEKVRLGEQLKQVERLKTLGEFAAGVVHEINNPIGIICACAEVMEKKLSRHGPEMADCVKTAQIIQDEAIRCSSIVKNLLGFARQGEINPEEVDVEEVLGQVVKFIKGHAAASNVEMDLKVSGDIPLIIGDAHQLEQVFLNLSINAIEAMAGGGRLEVSACCAGDEARISFSDSGPGIEGVAAQKLFNPFFTTKSTGTGLGLSVSLGIVERHGGRIEVGDSDAGGACFTVVLPLTIDAWEDFLPRSIGKHLHAGE
ncbi:MAG TPA: ATP-binding protein [Bacillota bacterium]|nr:ATP-binding protein [Bacillota bacterium]